MDDAVYTIEEGRVGGRPGPAWTPWDLRALWRDGWRVVVSFECDRFDLAEIAAAGFEHKRLCVEDFTAPTTEQLLEFNEFVDRKLAEGKRVLAHCHAGRGRTGTFLASRLLWLGSGVKDAIAEIRGKVEETQGSLAGAIEPEQVEALHHFHRFVQSRR